MKEWVQGKRGKVKNEGSIGKRTKYSVPQCRSKIRKNYRKIFIIRTFLEWSHPALREAAGGSSQCEKNKDECDLIATIVNWHSRT